MATLRSRYSDAVSANVPSDRLAPKPAVLGTIEATQDEAVTNGRTEITLNWTAPTQNAQVGGDHLGQADGAAQDLEGAYADLVNASQTVYEVTGYTAGGLDTTLSVAASVGDITITVTANTNAVADDWIEIKEGTDIEYAQIKSINVLVLTLYDRLSKFNFTTSATVKEIDVVSKTVTTDYTINNTTGVFSLVPGQFTSGKEVFAKYTTNLSDLDGYEIYRIPGNMPLADGSDRAAVIGHGSVVTVDTSVVSTATDYTDTLASTENGENHTYYLFAKDDESTPNYAFSDAVFVETIPSLPENLGKTTKDAGVVLTWDALPGGSDANTNGFNIRRDDGATFEDSTAVTLNSAIIVSGTTTFDDSADNVTNRVAAGTVPYPVNGLAYSYKVESEDTDTAWSTGTVNQSSGQSANYTASKAA